MYIVLSRDRFLELLSTIGAQKFQPKLYIIYRSSFLTIPISKDCPHFKEHSDTRVEDFEVLLTRECLLLLNGSTVACTQLFWEVESRRTTFLNMTVRRTTTRPKARRPPRHHPLKPTKSPTRSHIPRPGGVGRTSLAKLVSRTMAVDAGHVRVRCNGMYGLRR